MFLVAQLDKKLVESRITVTRAMSMWQIICSKD